MDIGMFDPGRLSFDCTHLVSPGMPLRSLVFIGMFDPAFVSCHTGTSSKLDRVESNLLQMSEHQRGLQHSQDQAFLMINNLGQQVVTNQKETKAEVKETKAEVIETKEKVSQLSQDVQKSGEKLVEHQIETKEKVSDVQVQLTGLSQGFAALRREVASREDTRQQYMKVLHTLFNGATGVVGMCPVGFKDTDGVHHKLLVLSMPIMIWYLSKAKTGVKLTELAIRSFFASGSPFQLAPMFVYSDFIDILIRTPYKIRAIGPKSDRNEGINRNNFIILDGETARAKLAEAKEMYNIVDTELALEPVRRAHTHGNDGQRIAFTKGTKTSNDSGPIQIYGNKFFTMEAMARIPAMGIPWTVEMYDLPYVYEFFGTTKAAANGRHIVGGKFAGERVAPVKTHAQEYKARGPEMLAMIEAKNKKRKR